MVESLVIDRVIEILNNNISVDELINLDIVDNSKISKEDSIFIIEKRLKEQINDLVLTFGIVGALKKILALQQTLDEFEPCSNTILLSIGAKLLYDRILDYYTPVVYAKIVKWFPRLFEGTITSEEIWEDVKRVPFTDEFLLGIVSVDDEQISLFGDVSNDTLNDLVIAVNNKHRVKSAAKKAIRRAFSKEEIHSVFFELSNILTENEDVETVIFLRALLREIPDINKEKKKRNSCDMQQLRIKQFLM